MHLGKRGLDKNPSYEVYEQRDVDAARALVKMANSVDLSPIIVSRENAAEMCEIKLSESSMDSFFEGELSRYEKDLDAKPAKKQKSVLNLPAICDAFSYSVVHLISSVRIALITPFGEDYVPLHGKNLEGHPGSHKEFVRGNLDSLTTHEIVQRVRLNPRDYRILEAKEPLRDLVRGVLNILASRTAPSGAIYWKALVLYEGNSKRWSWIGPLASHYLPVGHVQEEMSPSSWGLARRTLEKLVSSVAEWLKTSQEACQKLRSLPEPPQGLVSSERLIEYRGVKSLKTINPITDDIRAYFRLEEALRYMIPQRVFSYTALDGRKSTVAPIARISGKPSIKIRQHHILKENRPPYFTVVCLVRDATARLPGRMGTRADICTLVRDSQFIIEDVSDMQINQVISSALDRLHYGVDPCVRFDKEARVWLYLHGDREEEDFDNVYTGTQKTKKAKTENNVENSGTEEGSFESKN